MISRLCKKLLFWTKSKKYSSKQTQYTQCDKFLTKKDQIVIIRKFLTWLKDDQEIYFAKFYRKRIDIIEETNEELLASYFNVDYNKLENEKMQILETLNRN